jgi:hypothetical protein
MVAQEHNGSITNAVTDYYGRATTCDLAVIMPSLPRGIGVKINRRTGAVTFNYDSYGGYEPVAKSIADEITQNYTTIALIRAMKSLGYDVEEEPASNKRKTVVLVGKM